MSRRSQQQRLGGPQLLVLQRQVRRGMPGRQRPAAGRRKEPAQGRGRWRRSGRTGARAKRKPGRSLGAQRISRPRRGPKAWNVLHAWQHIPAGNGCVSGPLCRIASASSCLPAEGAVLVASSPVTVESDEERDLPDASR